MLIRWTFSLSKDQNLAVDVRDPEEDQRINDIISGPEDLDWLYISDIPGVGNEAYINLKNCNAIVRQEINEQVQANDQTQTVENREAAIPVGSENPSA